MLFNTYEFIFYFLLPVLGLFLIINKKTERVDFKLFYLIVVSVIFYAQWDLVHLLILCSSIVVNFMGVYLIVSRPRLSFVFILISLNLVLLGYFKYSGFLHLSDGNIVLPLAISFFTFQQIAYVVDIYKGKIQEHRFLRYLFFVLFFPQLIAGPIVHYNDIIPQIKKNIFSVEIKAGLILFSIGLFKKVVLGDSLALISTSSLDAWSSLLSYSLMIYFDFSGYADMAVGLGLFFGIVLPVNFLSPYKARNLVEFWRKWHITLGIFLKEHIYIPLGGSKSGNLVLGASLMITMLVGGVWHGAGWNFIVWGGMHGLGLVFLHVLKDKIIFPKFVSVGFTFLFVTLLWVLFRNSGVHSAMDEYVRLFSFDFTHLVDVDMYVIAVGLFVVFVLVNSMEVVQVDKKDFGIRPWHAYISAIMLFVSLKFMAEIPSMEFVYFNF